MTYDLPEWKAHVLVEVGAIATNVLDYSHPNEVATRLRAIATDLDQFYGAAEALPESSRPEINEHFRHEQSTEL